MARDRRDGSKLSFSDLDKLRRERKLNPGEPRGSQAQQASAHAQKSYRAALERAFDSGKLAELAATLQRSREPQLHAPRIAPSTQPAPRPAAGAAGSGEPRPKGEVEGEATAAPAEVEAGTAPRSNAHTERRQLTKQITEATASRDIAKAVDRYLARFEALPRDYEVLEKALSHPKQSVVRQSLELLDTCIADSKPRRSRSLAAQLSLLEETHEDGEIRDLAARVRAAL